MPQELTIEQVTEKFLDHVRHLVKYWDEVDDRTTKRKLEGLAFSILSAIDGCSVDLTGFILAPCPHEDDKAYNIEHGEDWYPQNNELNVNCDIAGSLHDLFYKEKKI